VSRVTLGLLNFPIVLNDISGKVTMHCLNGATASIRVYMEVTSTLYRVERISKRNVLKHYLTMPRVESLGYEEFCKTKLTHLTFTALLGY
jgi:hypothetical protein